jgi:hypothetical protein
MINIITKNENIIMFEILFYNLIQLSLLFNNVSTSYFILLIGVS